MFRSSLKALLAPRFSNLALILLSVALGASLATGGFQTRRVTAQDSSGTTQEQRALLRALENAFTSIADRVEPSVVSIEARSAARPVSTEPRGRGGQGREEGEEEQEGPFSLPDLFRRFEMPQPRGGVSGGSGLIVRTNGNEAFILTNHHVVRGQERFKVTLQDKTRLDATVVGSDDKTDLAVLKVKTDQPLPPRQVAQLGDSDRVRVGQWAIAIGSPLRYESTLTVGVISAKGRDLNIGPANSYRDLIQTDAAINPGNSGGPLVNIDGEVVGINVAIASPGGTGNIGIGFAIPVNQAKMILDELITTGQVRRGYLGIRNSPANAELSKELQDLYGVKGGALVEDVPETTSPAAKAGLKSEDVIIRFGSRPINSFRDLEAAVAATKPGTTVPVTIVRNKREQTVQVTIVQRPTEEELAGVGRRRNQPARPQQEQELQSRFGLTVRPTSEANTAGVEIAAVAPDSPAEEARLQQGDIITRVGSDQVRDVATFRAAMEKVKASSAVVLRVLAQSANGRTARIVVLHPQAPQP